MVSVLVVVERVVLIFVEERKVAEDKKSDERLFEVNTTPTSIYSFLLIHKLL